MSGERESRRVLVVDHNDSFRAVLVRALAERGCEVDEAPDCETGISKAETSHFDVVFVDCFMPRCGGDEATRIIVARDPGTKVIIISRKPTSDRVERAIEFGAEEYFPSRSTPENLRNTSIPSCDLCGLTLPETTQGEVLPPKMA